MLDPHSPRVPSPNQPKLPRLTGSKLVVRSLVPGSQVSRDLAVHPYMIPSSVPQFPHPYDGHHSRVPSSSADKFENETGCMKKNVDPRSGT